MRSESMSSNVPMKIQLDKGPRGLEPRAPNLLYLFLEKTPLRTSTPFVLPLSSSFLPIRPYGSIFLVPSIPQKRRSDLQAYRHACADEEKEASFAV